MTVSEILAQAPLLLSMTLKEEKNMGQLPLVPYLFSFLPQKNGDIVLEVRDKTPLLLITRVFEA
jgi:hypothetical protein